tara:strand:+ start:1472 stop:1753 length:282 start_codon:yes stop_codon:yes gene_type:complete
MKVTYEEYGDIKTEEIDEYGDKIMSRYANGKYFEVIEMIQSSGEDYNRANAIKLLIDVGMSMSEVTDFLNELEQRWDMEAEGIAEQQREQEDS